jgi:nitroimidazol reductase NimA-like FMN-containing flavoprotein (pyridoxamine 5'-phosphate oxidase superfamily)
MSPFTPTDRTRVKRRPQRAVYDREQVYSILDEGFVCHVGFTVEGRPVVMPTAYGRAGDRIYIHGSAASRMLRSLAEGIDVCVTVTLVDGLVLGRSAFHTSMNYRSVVIFGKARLVTDREEKLEALRSFTNHVIPGRWEEVRQPTDQELAATSALALPLEEVSAKVRTGGPIDDEEDYPFPVWAGVVAVRAMTADITPDEHLLPGVPIFDAERLRRFSFAGHGPAPPV